MIAVVTPVYNAERFIIRCIESVKNQSYQDYIHYVVNDGSLDSTLSLINQHKHDKLRILSSENKGVVAARNWALDEARNDGCLWLAFLDADDYWSKEFLEVGWTTLRKARADLVTGAYFRDYVNGTTDIFTPNIRRLTTRAVLTGCDISCLSTICRLTEIRFKNVLREDLLYWYEFLERYNTVCTCNEPYAYYTLHGDNTSSNKLKMAKGQLEVYRALGMNIFSSCISLLRWGYYGFKKYR